MRSSRRRACALLALAVVALSGCNDDGRTLEPTSATMPPSEIPTTAPVDDVVGLRVTSPDVQDGGELAAEFTCAGSGAAPEFLLGGAPSAAAELALAVVDLDAADRVHLVVSGLPATTGPLDLDELPDGAVLGRGDGDLVGWDPPCPSSEGPAHRYEVRLYAMAEPVGLTAALPGSEAVDLLEQSTIDVARLQFRDRRAA